LRRDGKDAEAVRVLEQALALQKDDFDIENELGPAYDSLGRYEQAAAVIERALQQRPREYALTVQLARCYVHMGRLDRAKEAFGRAKKIDPKEQAAYIEQGYARLHAGEFDAARQEFESFIALDTSNPLGYHHLGAYLGMRGDYREAEGYFLRAVQLFQAQPWRHPDGMLPDLEWLGKVRFCQGKYPEAEAAWRQGSAVAWAPPLWKAIFLATLGKFSAEHGRMAEAERYCRKALALCDSDRNCFSQPWGQLALRIGDCYAAQGRKPKALALARRIRDALRGAPVNSDNITNIAMLAELFQRLGEDGEAEALWGRIVAARGSLQNHHGLGRALAVLAGIRLKQGRLAEARGLYLQAIETHGLLEKAAEMANALNGLAEVYDQEGRSGEAQAARRRAAEFKVKPTSRDPQH